MSVAADICRKITDLTPGQIQILEGADSVLALAADLAHAQVTLYAVARNSNYLAVVSQARPQYQFFAIQVQHYSVTPCRRRKNRWSGERSVPVIPLSVSGNGRWGWTCWK